MATITYPELSEASLPLTGNEVISSAVPQGLGFVDRKFTTQDIADFIDQLGYVSSSGTGFFDGDIPVYDDASGKFIKSSGCSISSDLVINSRGITFTPTTTEPGLLLKNLTSAEITALSPATYPGAIAYATDVKYPLQARTDIPGGRWPRVGTVDGPTSPVTDTAIAVFDGTSGELIKQTQATIDANGVINSFGIFFNTNTANPGLRLKNLANSDILALSAATFEGAVVYDTTNNQIMWSNGTSWENLTGNTGLDFGYVTVGGGSAQYANFTAALAAGKNKFWVIGSFSETSDVTIFNSDDYSVICNPGVIVTFSNASLIINNNVSNLFWQGGTLLYAMTSAPKNWLQYYGVGKANSFFTDCIIQSISTQAGSYWNDNPVGGTVQVFNNVQWIFPDISGNGPRIGGGTSTIMRMSGGGTSCDDILTVTGGNVSGLTLNGVYSTNTVLSFGECTWSNSYIGSNTGTPLARVNLYNNASVNNVIAKSDAGWRLIPIGTNISINNFISGDIGSFFTGAGSDAVNVSNSVIASASITISPFAPVFTNVNFTQTSDLTIQSTAADLTSCKFACNVVLDADFITLNTPKVGDTNAGSLTISVSGVDQCSINSPITEADIVDGGTNTGIANPRKW